MTGSATTLVRRASEFRAACQKVRDQGLRLGLVPTMGALHRGHLALIESASRRADRVFVTLFVNPAQFGPHEDFASYPRTLERDLRLCTDAGVALAFAPDAPEMYPDGEQTRVNLAGLATHLCGRSRPGHFDGVATVVTKLFVLAGPCLAVFGRKDYQQLKIVERLVQDLLFDVQIAAHPTLRDADALALSSRNERLSAREREQALSIPLGLSLSAQRFFEGERACSALLEPVKEILSRSGLRIDYVTLADPERLTPIETEQLVPERALLAVAVFAGTTRLIDSLVLGEDAAPLSGPARVAALTKPSLSRSGAG